MTQDAFSASRSGSHDGVPGPKRLLMIAAGFPPTGGPGVQRTAKFAKYLPEFGWHPTVWAVDRIDGLPEDPTLLADIGPNVTVCRKVHGRHTRLLSRSVCATKIGNMLVPRVVAAMDWRLAARRAGRFFPDEFEGWARSSVSPLLRLIEEQGVEALYSTYSPASNHLLALTLKQQTALPWVADFRDLWTDDFRYREPSRSRRDADRRLEQQILEEADVVIGVTPSQTRWLASRVENEARKFRTITNGFDPEDFAWADETRRADGPAAPCRERPFTLSFVGRFERRRASAGLLAGLTRFVQSEGVDSRRFVFRIVGHTDRVTRAALAAADIPHDLIGTVSHAAAVREMLSADALLLSTEAELPNAETVICAKVFEYLASRRPILVVGPEGGECERIVQSAQAGLTVGPDERETAQALATLFHASDRGEPLPGADAARIQRYNRRTLTQQLAGILDELSVRSDSRPADRTRQRTGSMAEVVNS